MICREKITHSLPKGVEVHPDAKVVFMTPKSILGLVIIPLIPLTILAILATDQNLLKFGGLDHFYIEIISVILSFVVAYYCIMRGYAFNDKFTLFLGLGFHAAGMIDLLHAIFSLINLDQLVFTAYFIPQTWVAGRIVMGAVVMIALLKFAKPSMSEKPKEKVTPRLIALYTTALAALAGGITLLSIFQPFPFVTIDFIIKRPYELISAGLFLIAIFSFYKYKIFTINDIFYKAVAVSILVDIFVNIIISYSSFVFDTAFNISHMLKIVSFFILVMGFSYSVVRQYKEKDELSESLQTSEAKFRNLYETSPALHRTIDTNGIILDCNDSYAKRFGYTKDEIIGSTIFKFIVDGNKDALRESFETWKKHGTVHNREVWFKTKDGKTFPALISANNLYSKNGNLIGSNTIIREITDFYKAKKAKYEKKEVQNKIEELKKIDLLKEEFASMISHELKTPLLPIIGFCELLKEPSTIKKLDKVERDNIDEILSNTHQLEKLVRDVLDVQKLDMNQLTFNKEKFSVGEFLTELKKEITPLLSEKQIQLTVHPLEESWLEADKDRLKQVFHNLIKNAVDFVPANKGKIEIKTEVKDNHIVFCVKDNGIGIPEDKQKDLFKKFYQIDTSLTRKHGGTGLGLVICKGIVEAMGGKIWVKDKRRSGVKFYFSMPNLQVKPLVVEH